jgi:3',5'-cyclic AMP phosphodiesterase CpdA
MTCEALGLHDRVDALFVTGDFVSTGIIDEFRRAWETLEEVLKDLKLSVDRLVIIPGNHDVQWDPGAFAGKGSNPRVSMDNYREFAKHFAVISDSAAQVSRIKSQGGRRILEVIGIDSNGVEGPETGGIGFVSRETLVEASRFLEIGNAENGALVDRVMLVHHHILPCTSAPLEYAKARKVSVMANAAEVLERANRWGVELILHGHEHQPMVTLARRWPVGGAGEFNSIIVMGAGSFSVKSAELGSFARNHYYVICLRKDDIIVRSRWIGDNGTSFVGHNDLVLRRNRRVAPQS